MVIMGKEAVMKENETENGERWEKKESIYSETSNWNH